MDDDYINPFYYSKDLLEYRSVKIDLVIIVLSLIFTVIMYLYNFN
jgi:hypothetical protein